MCHGCQSKKTPAKPNPFERNPAKVVLLGSSQSGKTSLIFQFVFRIFPEPGTQPHCSFLQKIHYTEGNFVKFGIWDPDREKMDSSSSMYLKDADGIMICFSVGDQGSFEAAEYYLEMARKEGPSNVGIILVGNKCDLTEDGDGDEKRKVGIDEAGEFVRRYGLPYIETSAKEDINVSEAFERIVKEKLKRMEAENEKEEEDLKKKDSYCSMF